MRPAFFNFKNLPLFEQTLQCLEKGFLTKAHGTNAQYTKDQCRLFDLTDTQKYVLCDPQTSGGLMLSISPEMSGQILEKLRSRFKKAALVGHVEAKGDVAVEVLG